MSAWAYRLPGYAGLCHVMVKKTITWANLQYKHLHSCLLKFSELLWIPEVWMWRKQSMTQWSCARLGPRSDAAAETGSRTGRLKWSLAGFRGKGELAPAGVWGPTQSGRMPCACLPLSCHATKLQSHSRLHYSFWMCPTLTLQSCSRCSNLALQSEQASKRHSWILMVILGNTRKPPALSLEPWQESRLNPLNALTQCDRVFYSSCHMQCCVQV